MKQNNILITEASTDYELLDSAEGEKLERFGQIILSRPDPQALWSKRLDSSEWKRAHGKFGKEGGNDSMSVGAWLKILFLWIIPFAVFFVALWLLWKYVVRKYLWKKTTRRKRRRAGTVSRLISRVSPKSSARQKQLAALARGRRKRLANLKARGRTKKRK